MHSFYLGIDVVKAKLDCALRLPEGKIRHKVVLNTPAGFQDLGNWLVKQGADSVHVCMEATGIYWEAVAAFLAGFATITVSAINPAQIKAFGAALMVRTKTDKADAELIALFCGERRPAPWQPPTPAEQALHALVLRLDALQEANRLEGARPAVRAGIVSHLEWLDQEIARLIKAIHDPIDADPTLHDKQRLLDSIPGLDPRQHESGRSVKAKPRRSQVGHAFLREALYMPAMVTLYKTDRGKRFHQRLTNAGKPPMLIIGAMMRKLLHAAYGVLKSGTAFDPARHGA